MEKGIHINTLSQLTIGRIVDLTGEDVSTKPSDIIGFKYSLIRKPIIKVESAQDILDEL